MKNHLRCIAISIPIVVAGCTDDQSSSGTSAISREGDDAPQVTAKAERRAIVTLTPKAAIKIREVRPIDKLYLRVAVIEGGTTGFRYDMKFDDGLNASNDFVNESDGVVTVVDKTSALFLEGATIDWEITSDGTEGFKFNNPNAIQQ